MSTLARIALKLLGGVLGFVITIIVAVLVSYLTDKITVTVFGTRNYWITTAVFIVVYLVFRWGMRALREKLGQYESRNAVGVETGSPSKKD